MRIVVNGWFAGQMGTGTGQYLEALEAWLPAVGAGHEWVVVVRRPPQGCFAKTANGKRQTANVTSQTWPARVLRENVKRHELAPGALSESTVEDTGLGWRVVYADAAMRYAGENVAKVWWEQVTFPRICRKVGADLAFVPYWGGPWWRPCPVVVTIHDLIPLLLPAYRGNLPQRAYTWLVGRTARRATAVLTDSAASRRDIARHLDVLEQRVHPVHLAADQRLRPAGDPAELARVRQRYGLPDLPFWLYLGGFDARKNLPRLLEAYARLRGSRPGQVPPLVIAGKLPAGDSAFAPDPRPIAHRLGIADDVHFTGWVDEVDKPALYTLAGATFFLSEYEGFGLPVLEAQACGCPVVTSA